MHDPVFGLGENVETVAINARLSSGQVVDAKPEIQKNLTKISENGEIPILHSVFGSKTGICQFHVKEFKDQVQQMGGFMVVDACQGRFDKQFLKDLIDDQIITLITGSKFFRGPPFSGACIVPEPIM